jgi:phosphoribosyl 1,2-cyclic phosphodiesterase/CheY-like chemotaxis protein
MKTSVLIDDDVQQRTVLAGWLKEAGWRVFEAEDGETGMELILKHRPDLVVCDLLMPRFNGFQLCRQVRKEEALCNFTKIVTTTGGGYPTDRNNALAAGADEYVVKPISHWEFIRLVNQLMGDWDTVVQLRRQQNTVSPPLPMPRIGPVLPLDEPMRLKFWGVRGSIPTPGPLTLRFGGNTSCLEVRADGEIIVLDAGTGIAPLGAKLVEEFTDRPLEVTVLISHTHWDHIQGFPFFEPAYNPKNRVRILGFKGAREGLQATLSSQMESPYFPITMSQMPSNIVIEELRDLKFNIGKVSVEATYLNHPGLCVGYRINSSCGSISYLPDNEPYQRFKYHTSGSAAANSPEAIEYARRQDQRIIDFVQGSDVLVIDSQYDSIEYQKRIGWGHGCVDDVIALALSAKVKKLFLFHHDPRHDDKHIESMVEWARNFTTMLGEEIEVAAAEEGLEVVLQPLEKVTS